MTIAGQDVDAIFEDVGPTPDPELDAAIDAAYANKYPGSSAVPTMQGAGPTSVTVRISPR